MDSMSLAKIDSIIIDTLGYERFRCYSDDFVLGFIGPRAAVLRRA